MSGRRPLLRMPAVQALLAQAGALALVLLVSLIAEFTIADAVLLQGVTAAVLSRALRMERWWAWIHLLFPPAAAAVHALRLPPWIFLGAFAGLVALYWTSFRTQVPYYPSRRATWDVVAGLLDQRAQAAPAFIDIGSGFGGLVMHLARGRPEGSFAGIELAPLPWLLSVLRARVGRSRARFLRGDYEALDFSRYDVVFAYLSPAAMPALWEKARREMARGSLLLSHEFPVPGKEPDLVVPAAREGGAPLYGWRF